MWSKWITDKQIPSKGDLIQIEVVCALCGAREIVQIVVQGDVNLDLDAVDNAVAGKICVVEFERWRKWLGGKSAGIDMLRKIADKPRDFVLPSETPVEGEKDKENV